MAFPSQVYRPCGTCGQPSTHWAIDVYLHRQNGFVTLSYAGAQKFGCDAHQVTSDEIPTDAPPPARPLQYLIRSGKPWSGGTDPSQPVAHE